MTIQEQARQIFRRHIIGPDHKQNDYFQALRELVALRSQAEDPAPVQERIEAVYDLLRDEILHNTEPPRTTVKFGTSGWRGLLGKDLNIFTVASVTAAIIELYHLAAENPELRQALGVRDFKEMQDRGCVVGYDNRFGGEILALAAVNVLAANNIRILYAGEATTGILSASVLVRKAAFSINLTPSHNPLEYGGYKYNAADAGPAAPILTNQITIQAQQIIERGTSRCLPADIDLQRPLAEVPCLEREDGLESWKQLIRANRNLHGLDYDRLVADLASATDVVVGIDAVHGASRNYLRPLLADPPPDRFFVLRDNPDVTFDGISPEPSSANMQPVMAALRKRQEPFKIGAIIDPDGDRIRFTDGTVEISMNQFGAMAYHFLHEHLGKRGMVAKTVASSNLANALAKALGEEVFEPRVGFKEFKPVIGRALVYFEESDGISIIGHTPEKDAFIGLILALAMVLTLKKNLGDYLEDIEKTYGTYFPDRDGVVVSQQGEELKATLAALDNYTVGSTIRVGDREKTIAQIIAIDGRKMLFEDGSWLMIRPSGTEPKVRFYVEARSQEETAHLVETAKSMLAEIGLLS